MLTRTTLAELFSCVLILLCEPAAAEPQLWLPLCRLPAKAVFRAGMPLGSFVLNVDKSPGSYSATLVHSAHVVAIRQLPCPNSVTVSASRPWCALSK